MTVYLDSTFVIRHLLGVGKTADYWGKWEKAYASELLRVECFRAADRLRLEGKIDDAGRSRLGSWIETVCETVTQIPVTASVMRLGGRTTIVTGRSSEGVSGSLEERAMLPV